MDANGKRWAYEDFVPGMVLDLGSMPVSAKEIIEFAKEFDPQPMHLDEEAGEASVLGGLSAAGFHVGSMMMRLMCDGFLLDSTSQGAPGLDFLHWRKPVLAGDTISLKMTVEAKRESKSRPNLGLVTLRQELSNQHGEQVCDMQSTVMFLKRNGSESR
jgi:acyl dehydratase